MEHGQAKVSQKQLTPTPRPSHVDIIDTVLYIRDNLEALRAAREWARGVREPHFPTMLVDNAISKAVGQEGGGKR